MITIKMASYSREEMEILFNGIENDYHDLLKCCKDNCPNCSYKTLCIDLASTVDFLADQRKQGFPKCKKNG